MKKVLVYAINKFANQRLAKLLYPHYIIHTGITMPCVMILLEFQGLESPATNFIPSVILKVGRFQGLTVILEKAWPLFGMSRSG